MRALRIVAMDFDTLGARLKVWKPRLLSSLAAWRWEIRNEQGSASGRAETVDDACAAAYLALATELGAEDEMRKFLGIQAKAS